MDVIISQYLPEYLENLRRYNRSLKARNKLLSEEFLDETSIEAWTHQLITSGSKISLLRYKFFGQLNEIFMRRSSNLRYRYKIKYKSNLITDKNNLDDLIEQTYKKYLTFKNAEIRRGRSLFGPHYDDWDLLINYGKDNKYHSSSAFASRGEQRMSLIYLQFAFVDLFREHNNIGTILLLDDIYSELDEDNKHILTDFILDNDIQSFITGVDKREFGDKCSSIHINEILEKKNEK
jgi:DNA replication and repair protein RecF